MVAPQPPVNVVLTDGSVFPPFVPAGSHIYIDENVSITISDSLLGQNSTLILGLGCKAHVPTGTTVTFQDNCCLIMEPGSELTTDDGSTLSFGAHCKVDFSQGLVTLGGAYLSDNKAVIELGKDTLFKAGYQIPISGNGRIQAPEFNPNNTVTVQDYAVFEAPAIPIFDINIDVPGNWHMDRAYPQWFVLEDSENWADSIHKAIAMKRTGEVFLQRGLYKVKQSIHIPYGIQLVGETGRRDYDYTTDTYKDTHGTIIAATLTLPTRDENSWKFFDFGCLVLVNINPNKIPGYVNNKQPSDIRNKSDRDLWEKAYPVATSTAIRNLSLHNGSKLVVGTIIYDNLEVVPELTGVFVAGACVFENLSFGAFKQAIVKTRDYADNMRILDCTFSKSYEFNNYPLLSQYYPTDPQSDDEKDHDEINSRYALHMVQLNGSGDNLIFRGNAFHSANDYNYALSVDNCFGGTISDNIINEKVRLSNCRGLTFTNNHMESDDHDLYGPELRIINSQITVSSNFFYKSEKNNIVVRGSAAGEVCSAILENNTFFCRFAEIPRKSEAVEEYITRYNGIIENWKKRSASAEICINPGADVQLRNQFRQMNGVNSVTWPTPVGVSFKMLGATGGELNPNLSADRDWYAILAKLTTLSPYLSSQGSIKTGFRVESLFNTQNTTDVLMGSQDTNPNVRWYAETGYYDYYAQVVFDKERRIVGTINKNLLAHITSSPIQHVSYLDCIINN